MRYFTALLLCCCTALALFSSPALAAFTGPRSAVTVTKVAMTKDAPNHDPCQLEGYIVERKATRNNNYVFKDDTGTIIISINDKTFQGQTVSPETKVRIWGIIDREFVGETRIRVRELKIVK